MLFSRRILTFNNRLPQFIIRLNSSQQVEYLKSVLDNGAQDWKEVKDNILKRRGDYNNKNIDAMMLKVMIRNKEFKTALDFAEYIKKYNEDLSLGATNGLLNLYYNYGLNYELSQPRRQFILDSYEKLYSKYTVLDYSTGESLLHALCVINEWKKCMKVLEDIKQSVTPTHSAYSMLIGTMFRINKKAEAMKMIDQSVFNRRPLLYYAYEEWIKYIFRKYKDKKVILKHLDEICTHISNTCAVVTKQVADKITEAYSALEWETNFTAILRKNGECTACHKSLDCLKLSDEEFTLLQNNVKEKLIVGSDLFLKSSPEELQKFLTFIKQTAPYDVVLDALNISFLNNKSINERLFVLQYVVNYFTQRNKKVLLIGRKHMMKWNGLNNIQQKTITFFTDNLSQDDPYFITAAILSGSHTDIVSRDLLRGHLFVMKQDNLRKIFQRWQWQHQWKVFMSPRGPNIQTPLKFTPCAQNNSGIWHIPYEADNVNNEGKINDGVPDCSTWLCLRPNSPKPV